MTIGVVIISGFSVFVLGQIFLKWIIEPVQDLRRAIGRVAHTLHFRARFSANPGLIDKSRITFVSEEVRRLASDLRESLVVVPCYRWTSFVFRLPKRTKILVAATQLVGLSNSLHESSAGDGTRNVNREKVICNALGIDIPEDE